MPARKRNRPGVRPQLSSGTSLGDDKVGRLLGDLADAQQHAEAQARNRAVVDVDLAVGVNRVAHGLGRKARGATLTPTVADATFAWSFGIDGDRIAVITVVGVAQPGATLEVF